MSRPILGVAALSAATFLIGCSDDGYGGKDYGQEFEKPADLKPGGTMVDPPDPDAKSFLEKGSRRKD